MAAQAAHRTTKQRKKKIMKPRKKKRMKRGHPKTKAQLKIRRKAWNKEVENIKKKLDQTTKEIQ